MTPKQIFKGLKGEWNLKRILGSYGTIQGAAIFSATMEDNELLYRESFRLNNFHKNSLYSYKYYLYRFENGKIVKYFRNEDKQNQIFYELKFIDKINAIARHVCNKDYYKANFIFYSPYNFKLNYNVNGPNKNYVIETEFSKV